MSVAERTGVLPDMIANGPAMPDACHGAWAAFCALHERRGSNGFGPSRLSYLELDAYQRVTGDVLLPWEIKAIQQADDEFFTAQPKAKPQ